MFLKITVASLFEADANKQNSTPKEDWDATHIDPADPSRAVREHLDTLDEAAFGAASEVQPKFTSHSDLTSQWTAARKDPAFFSFGSTERHSESTQSSYGISCDMKKTVAFKMAAFKTTNSRLLCRVKPMNTEVRICPNCWIPVAKRT
ncbi:hypothetical protein Sulfitobl28_19980 [Sulfitobacter pontiacus]|nr:hypothetical protein Sulfitobl28_19980 [Sulfitobacter pontiacus]